MMITTYAVRVKCYISNCVLLFELWSIIIKIKTVKLDRLNVMSLEQI